MGLFDEPDSSNRIIKIKDNFLFDNVINVLSYSDIPNQRIDISRVLNGQKPFPDMSSANRKEKKTLVILGFDIHHWSRNKKEAYRIRIENLLKEGFSIFHYINDEIIPFDLMCLNNSEQFFTGSATPSIEQVVCLLNVPASELFVFDEAFSEQFVDGDEDDWQHLVGLEEICLAGSPISMDSLKKLLHACGEHITKLDLSNCINLEGYSFEHLNLPNLKELIIDFTLMSDAGVSCQLADSAISQLVINSPCLSILNLKYVDISSVLLDDIQKPDDMTHLILRDSRPLNGFDSPYVPDGFFSKMSKLNQLDIQTESLSVLKTLASNDLTHLGIRCCEKIWPEKEELNELLAKFSALQSFTLDVENGDISSDFFDMFMFEPMSRTLTSLSLKNCQNILSLCVPENLNLYALKSLDLSNTPITVDYLNVLLGGAPNLKTVNLCGCKHLDMDSVAAYFTQKSLDDVLIQPSHLEIINLNHEYSNLANDCVSEQDTKKDNNTHANNDAETSSSSEDGYLKPRSPRNLSRFSSANTQWKDTIYRLDRSFVGKRKLPDPGDLRIRIYDTCSLNPLSHDDTNPFILSANFQDDQLQTLPHAQKKGSSVYDAYIEAGDDHYFCRITCDVTHEWQALRSLFPEEQLQQFYVSSLEDVEIKKSKQNDLHYIRLKNEAVPIQPNITVEMLFYRPNPGLSFNDLPEEIRKIANNCRGYRDQPLKHMQPNASAHDYLQALMKQRTGSCEQRSIVFKFQMAAAHPEIPVRLISNECHMYPEVLLHNQWIRCDLGGYASQMIVNEQSIRDKSRAPSDISAIELKNPIDVFSLSFATNGIPRSSDYIKQAHNLTTLTLEHLTDVMINEDVSTLDTLNLILCNLTADTLHNCFKRTPNLKTLVLAHCIMDEAQFRLLDFSSLRQLEHVTVSGRFVPDANALIHLIRTAPDSARWVIETDHIDCIEAEDLQERVDIQLLSRKLPEYRYFTKTTIGPEKKQIASLLRGDWTTGLINTPNVDALRLALQQHCQHISQESYYIHTPDELQCASAFIKRDGNRGLIHKGPGGPCADVLTKKRDRPLIFIINFNTFKPAHIARYNSLFDDPIRSVDGVVVPDNCKVIGLLDFSAPGVYQGGDFYSRFQYQGYLDNIFPSANPILPTDLLDNNAELSGNSLSIELCGGLDWEARLIGCWGLEGQQLIFKEGALLHAINKQYTSFVFNNAPLNDPDFIRFLQDMKLHKGVYHQGRLLALLPADFKLSFAQHMSFPDKNRWLRFTTDLSSEPYVNSHILNGSNCSQFLGVYKCDERTHGLFLHQGLIEQYQGRELPVYVSGNLAEYEWLTLIERCRLHKTTLKLSFAPGVELPHKLMPVKSIEPKMLRGASHTMVFEGKYTAGVSFVNEIDPVIIDISELHADDLLQSLGCKFNEEKLIFEFTSVDSFLLNGLNEGKTVILAGQWSKSLAEAMHPLLFNRVQTNDYAGKLIILSEVAHYFSLLPKLTLKPLVNTASEAIHLVAEYDERFDKVYAVLQHYPAVLITGATGIGKTHFITHDWQQKNPACHYGEDQILEWIKDPSPGIKTLFIDEANISPKQWTEFNGLYQDSPAIFYQKQYYRLSKEHKVIFSGNPLSYGGERQSQAFFQDHQQQIHFKPLPASVMVKGLGLSDAALKPIMEVVSYLSHVNPDEILITPREIRMMAYLTKTVVYYHPQASISNVAQYFAYNLVKNYVPKKRIAEFDQQFKPNAILPMNPIDCKDFVINDSNQEAVIGLSHHLDLRVLRCQNEASIPASGGLGGIVLEGEPGIGKSVLVKQILAARGLKEHKDFFYLPVSLSFKDKEEKLLQAFHQGMIVIIDEINSAPMLERLLNALLEGHDLDGQSANTPGFMLIGTQNPITFQGRIKTTLPMMHRLQTIQLPTYSKQEMLNIMAHLGAPKRIAHDLFNEFTAHQQKNPAFCFRDLLKAVKKWQKNHAHAQPIFLNLLPIKQVGSICKTVAIANVESYYAKELDYPPIALWSMQQKQFSIRKLVKTNGSVQGEILEHDQWRKNFTDLGFDTETVDFNDDIHLFLKTIVNNLNAGNLPVLSFAVLKDLGLPDPEPQNADETEHAGIITGYNLKTDELMLAHWGNIYPVDVVTLFNSASALSTTRKQEFYDKNRMYSRAVKPHIAKYLPSLHSTNEADLKSIIPTEHSGFKTKLLIVKKPDKLAMLQRRTSIRSYGFFDNQSRKRKLQDALVGKELLKPTKPNNAS